MNARWGGRLLAGVGLLLAGSLVWQMLALDPSASRLHEAADLILIGGSSLGMLYGGYWHARRSFPTGGYPRLFARIALSAALFGGLGVVTLYVGSEHVTPAELIETVHLTGSVGVVAGALFGTIEAEAVASAERATRVRAETEALEAERERFARLNDLLRHYVLNGVAIIDGYADRLRTEVPPEHEHTLDTIQERAGTMATLVKHVRALSADRATGASVDLSAALGAVVDDLPSRSDLSVEVVDRATAVRVDARTRDGLFLLLDAVATATDEGGTITVARDDPDRPGAVTVVARPARLPDPIARSLFEPISPGLGLEFYLAKEFVRPAGSVRLVENKDDALRFELSLRAA